MLQVVEFLVGDGPNNRYALICRKCHSHNGMALRDEFEYLTFRCAYCYHLNSALKAKPTLHPPSGSQRAGSSVGTTGGSQTTDAQDNGAGTRSEGNGYEIEGTGSRELSSSPTEPGTGVAAAVVSAHHVSLLWLPKV